MIGNSNNINTYGSHGHEHNVTDCIHERHETRAESGGGAKGAEKAAVTQEERTEKLLSGGLFSDGLKGMWSKALGFFSRIWNSDSGEAEKGVSVQTKLTAEEAGKENKIASGILSTTVVKAPEEKTDETEEEALERKVSNVESAVSGGLKKEQGGVKKFLQRFGETVVKAGKLFKEEKKADISLSENNTDFNMGDNSYLLDSYNKSGQYSTLAKDRSLEGNFKARG